MTDPLPDAVDELDLSDKIRLILEDLRDEYTQPHAKPWIIGFSGGKDSTLVAQLVFDMLLELPPSKRTRQVHILSNDTLVESPVVQSFVDKVLTRIGQSVEALRIPVHVEKTTPDLDSTFWVNLIGRGYPAPNRLFRWCTDRMKIRPTTEYIRRQAVSSGEVILLLGVRRSESSARSRSVGRYDNGARLNEHNDVKGCFVYRPIVELTTDEVWTTLLQRRPPWGGTHRELVTLYRNGQGGECPFVVDQDDAPSCGTSSSRFGCWTCTVVEKDRSLQGFIDAGFQYLETLGGFRDEIQRMSRDATCRSTERRNGNEGLGPFTMDARQRILDLLLHTQEEIRATDEGTELELISAAEIERIKQIWRDDESVATARRANRLLKIIQAP